jgi:hypothetical protein
MTSEQLRLFLNKRVPHVISVLRRLRYRSLYRRTVKEIFTEAFSNNKWGDADSHSGEGSNLAQTEAVRSAIPRLIDELGCRSMLDAPCGDFFWMRLVDMDVDYTGADIVDQLVEQNKERYGGPNRRFIVLDLLEDPIPSVDLVLSRDCLVHFSDGDALRAIKNIRASNSKYVLTTTFVDRAHNSDIPTGSWRPINLRLAPFLFPAPMELIDEQCPVRGYSDKHLALWSVKDIPDY